MNLPEAIIFDFDGVLVESNQIKHDAFKSIFQDFPKHFEEIFKYHYSHNSVDRFTKFNFIAKNILNISNSEEIEKSWAKKFQQLTRESIVKCSMVPGAMNMLDFFFQRCPLYIASATPDIELEFILKQRGLFKYFRGAFGSSLSKTDAIIKITKNEMLDSEKILFIGDSPEDQLVAKETGVLFIGRISSYHFKNDLCFNDLNEVLEYLKLGVDNELSQ